MNTSYERAYQALQQVAEREGVSFGHVTREIESAIHAAYTNARETGNKEALDAWERLCGGELPGAVEFVALLRDELTRQLCSTQESP